MIACDACGMKLSPAIDECADAGGTCSQRGRLRRFDLRISILPKIDCNNVQKKRYLLKRNCSMDLGSIYTCTLTLLVPIQPTK